MVDYVRVMDQWTEILDRGGEINAVYMDFMKAFYSVPHRRLLEKVYMYVQLGSRIFEGS